MSPLYGPTVFASPAETNLNRGGGGTTLFLAYCQNMPVRQVVVGQTGRPNFKFIDRSLVLGVFLFGFMWIHIAVWRPKHTHARSLAVVLLSGLQGRKALAVPSNSCTLRTQRPVKALR